MKKAIRNGQLAIISIQNEDELQKLEDENKVVKVLNDGDKIISSKQKNAYRYNLDKKKEQYIKNMEKGCFEPMKFSKFGIVNFEELSILMKELNDNEILFVTKAMNTINYQECCIMKNQKTYANTNDLMDIVGFSKPTMKKVIDSLISKDIIYKGRNSRQYQYFLNPWIAYKGDRLNKVLKVMFENYKIRSKGNIKWKDLK